MQDGPLRARDPMLGAAAGSAPVREVVEGPGPGSYSIEASFAPSTVAARTRPSPAFRSAAPRFASGGGAAADAAASGAAAVSPLLRRLGAARGRGGLAGVGPGAPGAAAGAAPVLGGDAPGPGAYSPEASVQWVKRTYQQFGGGLLASGPSARFEGGASAAARSSLGPGEYDVAVATPWRLPGRRGELATLSPRFERAAAAKGAPPGPGRYTVAPSWHVRTFNVTIAQEEIAATAAKGV
jgi:hypothetical protein